MINCAGLYSDDVAALLGNRSHRIYPVRGEYCELVRAKSYLVNNLVYPLPHAEGLTLGVHLTRTLWGTVLVGPTADYIADKNDYEGNRLPVEEFLRRAKPMLPELEASDLQLAYSGIRAKLVPPGSRRFRGFRDRAGRESAARDSADRHRVPGTHIVAGHRPARRVAG